MAKCKYPNEVCANMTVLNGNTYCDSVPCSLKDELPKQTNADRIRAMSDEELAEWLTKITDDAQLDARTKCNYQWAEWLQSEAEQQEN